MIGINFTSENKNYSKSLKTAASLAILIMLVFTQTSVHEFFKFPNLIDHFTEHRQHDRKMSLVDFLKMHYALDKECDKDYEKDHELPFKKCEIPIFDIVIPSKEIEVIRILHMRYHIENSERFINVFFSNSLLRKIWQPPKK